MRYGDNRFRRRESIDSETTRVIRPTDYHGRMFVPGHEDRRPPMTLRRTPLFYDKCDLCAYKIFRTGDYCPVRATSLLFRINSRRVVEQPALCGMGPDLPGPTIPRIRKCSSVRLDLCRNRGLIDTIRDRITVSKAF